MRHILMHLLLKRMQVSIFNVYSSHLRRNFNNKSSDMNHVAANFAINKIYFSHLYKKSPSLTDLSQHPVI